MTKEEKVMEKGAAFELAYLYTPLVPAADIEAAVTKSVKGLIEAAGGKTGVESLPKIHTLAYPVGRSVEHKRTVFTEAYFGSIAFTIDPAALKALDDKLKLEPAVLRFSILTAPKGGVVTVSAPVKRAAPAPKVEKAVETPAPAPAEPMTKEAIDKEIEGLLEQPA